MPTANPAKGQREVHERMYASTAAECFSSMGRSTAVECILFATARHATLATSTSQPRDSRHSQSATRSAADRPCSRKASDGSTFAHILNVCFWRCPPFTALLPLLHSSAPRTSRIRNPLLPVVPDETSGTSVLPATHLRPDTPVLERLPLFVDSFSRSVPLQSVGNGFGLARVGHRRQHAPAKALIAQLIQYLCGESWKSVTEGLSRSDSPSWKRAKLLHIVAASNDEDSSVASQKFLGVSNASTFSEQQYFVWDVASQTAKKQDMLEIWGLWPFWPTTLGTSIYALDEMTLLLVRATNI